jgi:cyanate permease
MPGNTVKAEDKTAGKKDLTAKTRSITSVYQTPVDWEVRDAMKTLSFWMILIFSATNTFTVQFFTTHEVIYLQDKGFTPVIAASALSLLVIISALSKLATGWIGTRIDNQYLATASMSLSGIGMFTLMQVTDVTMLYTSSVIIGVAYGMNVVFYPSFVGSYFGRKNYSRIMGIMSPFVFLIAFTAPIMAGFIFDSTKSYFWAFVVTISLITIAVICAILNRPPRPKVMPQ